MVVSFAAEDKLTLVTCTSYGKEPAQAEELLEIARWLSGGRSTTPPGTREI